jgi:hypothetical protein
LNDLEVASQTFASWNLISGWLARLDFLISGEHRIANNTLDRLSTLFFLPRIVELEKTQGALSFD